MAASDVGLRVVKSVRQRLQVEDEWSIDRDRGFTWWAGPLAQQVWAEQPYEEDGVTLSRIHIRTDLLRGVPDDEALVALAPFMRAASLSGLVWSDDDERSLQLVTCVYVHEQMEPALGSLLTLAAALQVAEAHRMVASLAAAVGGIPSESNAPGKSVRRRLHGIMNAVEEQVSSRGADPSVYLGPEFAQAAESLDQQGFLANGDRSGLTAEYPFGELTSLLTMKAEEPHPLIGNGLNVQLMLPIMSYDSDSAEAVQEALRLNSTEASLHTDFQFVGSWCPGTHGPAYRCFLPNLLGPGWAVNFTFAMSRRATWAADVFEQGLDPEVVSHARQEIFEHLLTLNEAEAQEMLENLPLDENREDIVKVMMGMRDAMLHQQVDKPGASVSDTSDPKDKCIRFTCSNCGKRMKAPENSQGNKARCPKCGIACRVPK